MALKLPSLSDTFKLVLRIDSAVGCDEETYKSYLKSLDESLLQLKEEPTRFVIRKVLTNRQRQRLEDRQFTLEDGKMKLNFSAFSEQVRLSIVGIENPASVPVEEHIVFKQSDDGLDGDIMAGLQAAGVVMEIYEAIQSAVGPKADQDALKKK